MTQRKFLAKILYTFYKIEDCFEKEHLIQRIPSWAKKLAQGLNEWLKLIKSRVRIQVE